MNRWHHWLTWKGIALLAAYALAGCARQPAARVISTAASVTTTSTLTLPPLPTSSPAPMRATPTLPPPGAMKPASPPGGRHTAYIQSVIKPGRTYAYSCEFDAAWVILQSYGMDVTVDDLIAHLPQDRSRNPSFVTQGERIYITGGDILTMYSGDYINDFLARTTGQAFAQVFRAYGLQVRPVRDATALRAALDSDQLVWLRATVDFHDGVPAIWTTPDGSEIRTVLGNDHTVVVVGYNERFVVIRDPLGPTDSNLHRAFEYEVPWPRFLTVWEQQDFDALSVARPSVSLTNTR